MKFLQPDKDVFSSYAPFILSAAEPRNAGHHVVEHQMPLRIPLGMGDVAQLAAQMVRIVPCRLSAQKLFIFMPAKENDLPLLPYGECNIDGLVKSRISDGFVKRPRSRLANPEE